MYSRQSHGPCAITKSIFSTQNEAEAAIVQQISRTKTLEIKYIAFECERETGATDTRPTTESDCVSKSPTGLQSPNEQVGTRGKATEWQRLAPELQHTLSLLAEWLIPYTQLSGLHNGWRGIVICP